MASPRNNEPNDNENNDFIVPVVDQSNGEDSDSSSSSNSMEDSGDGSALRNVIGLEERLTEIFVDESDGDLLLQHSNREDSVLQWLQALDLQVIGACRTDERLKPLLKMNASNGVADDCLLAHLSKHFEPVEVGMLARCFCIPLVSIRVGKIKKQGTLLRPTAARGNLNLAILPTSDLRLSFIGDDGCIERLLTVRRNLHCSDVTIHEISTDPSGRSFLIKSPSVEVFYFWCSEKSKLLGVELFSKMKDILLRKPSIAELTGISESRLECFAAHLRAYLVGSTVGVTVTGATGPHMHLDSSTSEQSDLARDAYFSPSKSAGSQHTGNQAVRPNSSFQGSLSPRSCSFKEGLPRNLSSLRNAAREKLRQHGNSHFAVIDNLTAGSSATDVYPEKHFENNKLPGAASSCSFSPSCFLDFPRKLSGPQPLNPVSQVPQVGSLLSPYYCWCPPGAVPLQCSAEPTKPSSSAPAFPLLPPLSSFLPVTMSSSLLAQTPPLNMVDCPSVDFPSLVPDSLLHLSMSTSQQIPTFTPLMCDSIVHIPVIDVCSSGPGYLVSAGQTISTTISPLHPQFVNPLIPRTDSMVEKGARETLRLLISVSGQTNPPLMDVLPSVLTNATDESSSVLVTGSRGLYSGTRDVNTIASSIAAISLVSLSGRSEGETSLRYRRHSNFDTQHEGSSVMGAYCSDDEEAIFSDNSMERTDH